MTAFNIVRFRVKRGHQQRFVAAHRSRRPAFKGFQGGFLVRTGEQTFCIVGQWATFSKLVEARPHLIAFLDETRHHLDDLGGGLGVTDPVSGEMVLRIPATRGSGGSKLRAAKRAAKRRVKRRKQARRKKRH